MGSKSGLLAGKVSAVQLLGVDGRLEWTQAEDVLRVKMPNQKPCASAYALRITVDT